MPQRAVTYGRFAWGPGRILGAIALGAGLICLVSVVFPFSEDSATRLAGFCGVVGLVFGSVLLWADTRTPAWVLHGFVALTSVAAASFVRLANDPAEQVLTAQGFIWIGVYVACFFGGRATISHLGFVAIIYAISLWQSPLTASWLTWFVMMATVVTISSMSNSIMAVLHRHAERDALTGLFGRAALDERARRSIVQARRTGSPLVLALIDLDNFKQVNDTVGHAAGDRLLTDLAEAWLRVKHPRHLIARYGGDEFAVLMPDTNVSEAYEALAQMAQVHPHTRWSSGVADWTGESYECLLERADRDLYTMKRRRRADDSQVGESDASARPPDAA